jgi:uncharacterized protein
VPCRQNSGKNDDKVTPQPYQRLLTPPRPRRRLRFVLLGSSARKLRQAGTNLLAGRALRRLMLPLLPAELGRDFDLARVLRWGSLPILWQAEAPQENAQSYVQLWF